MKFNLLAITLVGILVLFSVTCCSTLFPASNLPTLIPTEYIPTVVAQTVQAMDSKPGSLTSETIAISTDVLEPSTEVVIPTSLVTKTPTPEVGSDRKATPTPWVTSSPPPPVDIPYADIQFINPGALSRVVSPIELHAFLIPGDSGRAKVELFGEDGRMIYRKLFIFSSSSGLQTNLRADIDFDVKGVAETARLVISVDDAYGRLKALASEDLILISMGDSELNPPGDFLENIVIQEPKPKILIQGDLLKVTGLVRTGSEQPLLIELISTDGQVISNRLAGIAPEPEGGHRLFAAEIPFTVQSLTWVRVTVSEWNNRLGRPAQLSSVEVLLSP